MNRMKKLAGLLLLPSSLLGQQLRQMTRSTTATTLSDSSLTLVSDSITGPAVTKAASLLQLRKAFSLKAFDSVITANLRLTGAVNGTPTWSSQQIFANGQRVDSATGAVRAQTLTTARTLWGNSFNASANISGQILGDNGTAAAPEHSYTNSTGLGEYRYGADTLGFSFAGVAGMLMSQTSGGVPILSGASAHGIRIRGSYGAASDTVRISTYDPTAALVNHVMFTGVDSATTIAGSRLVLSVPVRLASNSAASPSVSWTSSSGMGFYRWGADTIGVATLGVHSLRILGGASVTLAGGAGNMTIQPGTGNSRTMTLQSTNSSGTVKNNLVLGADSSATFLGKITVADTMRANGSILASGAVITGGSTALVVTASTSSNKALTLRAVNSGGTAFNTLTLNGDSTAAFVGSGSTARPIIGWADSVGLSRSTAKNVSLGGRASDGNSTVLTVDAATGARKFTFTANSGTTMTVDSATVAFSKGVLVGGAQNTTFTAGTGNNRNFILQSTNASGTATTFATGAGDTLKIAGHAIAAGLTAASGTPHAACFDPTTHEMEDNAALTCTVSSIRFKEHVRPLAVSTAARIVAKLRPVTFDYKNGGRSAIGVIAEQADSVDTRLTTRDNQGRVNSFNYEELSAVLLSVVQRQQRMLDSLAGVVGRQGRAIDSLRLTLRKP